MEGKTVLDENADIYRHPNENLTEKEKLSQMGWKGRWQYFKDYYSRTVLMIGLIALCIACLFIFRPNPKTETVLYVGFINERIDQEKEEEVKEKLIDVLSLNPEEESVLFDYTLFIRGQGDYLTKNTMTVLMEQFFTGNIDLFVAEKSIFEQYEEQGAFLNLDTVFSKEDYEKLKDYQYDDCSYSLKESEIYHSFASLEDPVVGICVNSKHMERNIAFIKYLLEN